MLFAAYVIERLMCYMIYVYILQRPIAKLRAITLFITAMFFRPLWRDVLFLKTAGNYFCNVRVYSPTPP